MQDAAPNTDPNGAASAAVIFDADAEQRIPFQVEHESELYEIAFKVKPVSDEQIREYEVRRNVRQAEAEPDEASGREGMVTESDAETAAAWLFDEIATGVEGVGYEGELPDGWKEDFTVQEKAAVINQAVLAGEAVDAPKAKAGKPLPPRRSGASGKATIRLRALFSGRMVTTAHTLRDADAETMAEYTSLMRRGVMVQGTRIGQSAIYIPTRANRLGKIYDRLHVSAEGYAGRVPLHHKMVAVISHLGKQTQAVTKN